MKLICTKCKEEADIMSCRRIEKNKLLITYTCPCCGNEEIDYLYESILNEKEKQILHEGITLLIEDLEYQFGKSLENTEEYRKNKLKEIIKLRDKLS